MNYTEEYVEQLEKVIASLRGENAELRKKLAAAEQQNEVLKAEVLKLRRQTKVPARPTAVGGKDITVFFELTDEELGALAPAVENPPQIFAVVNKVLRKYNGNGGDVIVPDGLTCIGDDAFYNCKSLTSVTIPDGVTSIGNRAFFGCLSLKSITAPACLTNIGTDAFFSCDDLTIQCPAGSYAERYAKYKKINTSLTTGNMPISHDDFEIEGGVLKSYRGRSRDVVIPDGVTRIFTDVFRSRSFLNSVTIPDGVTSISAGAFSECSALKSVTIPDSVTTIGFNAFCGCKSLTSVILPDGVKSIDSSAFYGCKSLTELTIPDSVTSIGKWAFHGCDSLTRLTIPDGVRSIGDWTFQDCVHLTSVILPESVTSIGYHAFNNCKSLTELTIPKGVTSIDNWAFHGCDSLTVKCKPNSYVEAYCREKNIRYMTTV